MILGFTGTRDGMSGAQLRAVTKLVNELKPDLVVHGDCRGADTDFHRICINARGGFTVSDRPPRIKIWPSNSYTRAYNDGADVVMPAKPPLERDMDIARECDKLIATPKEFEEVWRSGTWTTRRYAIRLGKIVYTILPDGKLI